MTIDSTMNWLVPTILVLVVVVFLWIKTPLGAWLGPHLSDFWTYLKEGQTANKHHHSEKNKIIVYE